MQTLNGAARPGGASASRRGAAAWKAVILLVVAGAAVGTGYWAFAGSGAEADPAHPRQATADTAVATRMDFDIVTLANGELAAKNQVEIRSQLEAMSTIVEIVKEGERVKKGDQLVKLNGDQLQKQIDDQELEVLGAKADQVAAETGVSNQKGENDSSERKAQLKIDLAELALQQWELGEVVKKREELAQAIRRAQRDYDRLKDKVERSEELYAKDFLSKDELELDRIALDEAQTKLTTAHLDQKTYEEYQHPQDEKQKRSDVTEAKAEFERVVENNKIQLTAKHAVLDKATKQLARREESLAKLKSQLANCTINAPTDGLVVYASSLNGDFFWDSRGPLRIGREIAPNDLIIVLPDTSEMVASVRVHESLAGRIKPGLPASMKIEAVGNAVFTGKVESIGVLAETSGWRDPNRREYTVKLVMDRGQDGERLKPSMRCEAQIQLGKAENALAVPLQAVFNDGPVRYVYTSRGGKYVKIPVNIGQRSDTYAEITAGLDAGRRILVRQPAPGEVLDLPWDPEQLKVCGLKLNEKGEPVPINANGGRPGGRGPRTEIAGAEAGPGPAEAVAVDAPGQPEAAGASPAGEQAQSEEPAKPATPEGAGSTETSETATVQSGS